MRLVRAVIGPSVFYWPRWEPLFSAAADLSVAGLDDGLRPVGHL